MSGRVNCLLECRLRCLRILCYKGSAWSMSAKRLHTLGRRLVPSCTSPSQFAVRTAGIRRAGAPVGAGGCIFCHSRSTSSATIVPAKAWPFLRAIPSPSVPPRDLHKTPSRMRPCSRRCNHRIRNHPTWPAQTMPRNARRASATGWIRCVNCAAGAQRRGPAWTLSGRNSAISIPAPAQPEFSGTSA